MKLQNYAIVDTIKKSHKATEEVTAHGRLADVDSREKFGFNVVHKSIEDAISAYEAKTDFGSPLRDMVKTYADETALAFLTPAMMQPVKLELMQYLPILADKTVSGAKKSNESGYEAYQRYRQLSDEKRFFETQLQRDVVVCDTALTHKYDWQDDEKCFNQIAKDYAHAGLTQDAGMYRIQASKLHDKLTQYGYKYYSDRLADVTHEMQDIVLAQRFYVLHTYTAARKNGDQFFAGWQVWDAVTDTLHNVKSEKQGSMKCKPREYTPRLLIKSQLEPMCAKYYHNHSQHVKRSIVIDATKTTEVVVKTATTK